ncbi:Apocarotenoid-15,15'-oxygenase [Planktothrix tepida]|uniref:Carotenoid oxygenase n=1 Tax=Planktothrix tepida PCC 9214 TaxID=671072 RepID=A0A1J1LR55_9CYAN|nr:Apocarotenoid-15,15'-oxygenase [Planktothrix tepida]CUR35059.1 Carotenoid oxygenase [Planktothrix tepida PCC 9214]
MMIQTTPQPTWGQQFATPAAEFPPTPLPVLWGKLPSGLRGSLYRNGPGRLERGGRQVGHWFDGDGAILAVHFTDEGATGVYRYVKTAGYQEEEQANRLMYGGYGMTPCGNLWERFTKPLKNAANTSVLALPDKLLALWEGGQPHGLDLQTLETWGLDNLSELTDNMPYSAHPKIDPKTGDIFNFGQVLAGTPQLMLYRSDRTGKIRQHNKIPLDGICLIHDFVLAGEYLIFVIPPLRLQFLPVLLQIKPFSEAFIWQPQKTPTQILIIDRHTLKLVNRIETEPWFQWHFSNGYVEADGNIIVDFVRYQDFQTNQYLKEVATGNTHTLSTSTLWRMVLQPQTGKLLHLEEILDRHCEFPTVSPQEVGKKAHYTYLSIHKPGVNRAVEIFNSIGRFNHQTQTLQEANLGKNCYPMEPLFVQDRDNPQQGWVLTVVYDGDQNSSEVWVFDAEHLDAEPLCRLGLPSIVPNGFHGTWKPLS